MNNKISYPILALQIELLYQREFAEGNDKAIEDHCLYIANFIRSCGWTEEEYLERWMREQDGEEVSNGTVS
jgi:hypothetical protein